MTATACMRGWCAVKRDKCARYRPGRIEQSVLDRVCGPGRTDEFIPIYPVPAERSPNEQPAKGAL